MRIAEPDIWRMSDEERQMWRRLSRIFVVAAVGMFAWLVFVSGHEWHHVVGCMMIGGTAGKCATPHVRCLNTDWCPQDREFEMATASMSDFHAASSIGCSAKPPFFSPFPGKR